jgi:hypothetical protein
MTVQEFLDDKASYYDEYQMDSATTKMENFLTAEIIKEVVESATETIYLQSGEVFIWASADHIQFFDTVREFNSAFGVVDEADESADEL